MWHFIWNLRFNKKGESLATAIVANTQDKPWEKRVFKVNLGNKRVVVMKILSKEWGEGRGTLESLLHVHCYQSPNPTSAMKQRRHRVSSQIKALPGWLWSSRQVAKYDGLLREEQTVVSLVLPSDRYDSKMKLWLGSTKFHFLLILYITQNIFNLQADLKISLPT